jgi:hypothetical protein
MTSILKKRFAVVISVIVLITSMLSSVSISAESGSTDQWFHHHRLLQQLLQDIYGDNSNA